MSLQTWVTHPKKPFDSFYLYDLDTLAFVRIRLELGRKGNNPNPGIFGKETRYVGFVENPADFDFHDYERWTVNRLNEIVYKKTETQSVVLSRHMVTGKTPVDFTLPAGKKHPQFIHHGNAVIGGNFDFPVSSTGEQVTAEMLEAIAKKALGKNDTISLGLSTESSAELADLIIAEYNKLSVALPTKDTRSLAIQLAEAEAFFNDEDLPDQGSYIFKDNPYADKDGLVEFIIGTELASDPNIMKALLLQKKYLVAIISVVTDYINRYSEAYGEEYKTDIEVWERAMRHIPLMGPSIIDEQTYNRNIKGVSIAADFVAFLVNVVVGEGAAALGRFSDFLQKQGKALKFGIENNDDFYSTITVGVSIEVKIMGGEIVFFPKIKQYRADFNRQNSTWTAACASVEIVDIHFNYRFTANLFDYEALEDTDVKKDLDAFISKSRKAQIEDATTFFDDEFPPKNPE